MSSPKSLGGTLMISCAHIGTFPVIMALQKGFSKKSSFLRDYVAIFPDINYTQGYKQFKTSRTSLDFVLVANKLLCKYQFVDRP